jgi:acyl-CoA reductase-like NAD-dependent aldehyde dehydrogenase
VMTEEIFGPIVPFMKVSSADEAIRLANDSHLGLNAYVFTEDPERGRAIARKLEAGSVMVNDTLVNAAMAEMPFGGIKQSGFGRVLGEEGLRDLCNVKHVCVERFKMPRRHPLAFPYTERTYGVLLQALRALYHKGGALERLRRMI